MLASALRSIAVDLLDLIAPRRCAACDAPWPEHPSLHAGSLCAECAASLEPEHAPPRGIFAPFAHTGPLARAIVRAKFASTPATARALAPLLAHATLARLAPFDRVVAVPLHARRLAQRGYNQSVELARALGAPIVHGALVRTRDTPSQRGLGRTARDANVRGAFAATRSRALAGRRVLLVDDVVTTGATLREAADAVLRAGATRVACVALARAPLERA